MSDGHEMLYLAGLQGLGIHDNPQPHWYCTCGNWVKNRDFRGRPFKDTAQRHWRKHVKEAVSAEEPTDANT
jgi:hypothetical protein